MSERIFATVECGFVESLKVAFFLTSCQPNWPLGISQIIVDQIGVSITTTYELNFGNHSTQGIQYHHRIMDKNQACSVLALLTTHFNFVALTFFTMTTVVRFYTIVVSEVQLSSEAVNRRPPAFYAACVALVYAAACGTTILSWKDYSSFAISKACLRPNEGYILLLNIYGATFYACSVLQNVIVMALNMSLIFKLIRWTSMTEPVNESMVRNFDRKQSSYLHTEQYKKNSHIQGATRKRYLKPIVVSVVQAIFLTSAGVLGPGIMKHFFVVKYTNTHQVYASAIPHMR